MYSGQNRERVMTNKGKPKSNLDQPVIYQILIEGHLGRQWQDWFGGVTITQQENGKTLITCTVADQAALYALLRKVRDLGLPLISVTRLPHDQADRKL